MILSSDSAVISECCAVPAHRVEYAFVFGKTQLENNLLQNEMKNMLRRGGSQKPLDNVLNYRVQKQAESQGFSGVPWVMTNFLLN